MDFIALFKQLLITTKPAPSALTVKNYLSDLRNFIQWYEKTYEALFTPENLTPAVIEEYQTNTELSSASKQRRVAAMKKFFALLEAQGASLPQPFPKENIYKEDIWKLKQFKMQLHLDKVSPLTVKNYVLDIVSFKQWAEQLPSPLTPPQITAIIVANYRDRLIHTLRLSPASVNRKLSSIRRYAAYMNIDISIRNTPSQNHHIPTAEDQKISESPLTLASLAEKEHIRRYSSFPPFRLAQHFIFSIDFIEDALSDHAARTIRKKKLAYTVPQALNRFKSRLALPHITLPKKLRLPASSIQTIHIAAAGCIIIVASIFLFKHLYDMNANIKRQVLGIEDSVNSRILSFHGRLTDAKGNPITEPQSVRFAIYTDPFKMQGKLWQENLIIQPKKDGQFQVILGEKDKIPESIFSQENPLYLGVKIGDSPELSPRKQLISTSYAANSESLQGMQPITADDAGTTNVILALDSSGNLSIGNHANPTFQATDGNITLTGDTTILASNPGSNGDVQITPDGTGMIDLQGPIHNSSLNGTYPGAVEIADSTLISSSEPYKTSLIVNNDGFGDLFTASSSSITKFIIDRDGSVGIGTSTPQTTLDVSGDVSISGTTRLNSITYHWPSISGHDGYVLTTDGLGTLSWTDSAFTSAPSAVYMNDSNKNLLIGAESATSSAAFAFLMNVPPIPTASFSADLVFSGRHTISSTAMQPLQIGNSSSGSINFLNAGNVGIGTSTPQFKLDAYDIQANTAIARIYNASQGNQADGLTVQLGNTSNNTSSTNHFINFVTDGAGQVGAITGNGSNGVTYATGDVADFAEYLKKDPQEDIPFGSLICVDGTGMATACTTGGHIIGAASQRPAFLGGEDQGINSIAVGLVGQISVRITAKNGSIKAGDPITASSIAGIGQKATTAGFILGYALTSSDQALNGEINVLVQPSWYDPDVFLSQSGELHTSGDQIASTLNPVIGDTQTSFTVTSAGEVIKRVANLAQATIGTLYVGLIDAQGVVVHGSVQAELVVTKQLNITSDNMRVAGLSLKDYIVKVTSEVLPFRTVDGKPQVYADQIASNIISPLADDSQIALDLTDSKLQIKKDASSAAVTAFDNQGNATFSGILTAQTASVSGILAQDATVSGTLRTDTIIANSIQGLDQKVATIAAQYLNEHQTTSPTPTPTNLSSLPSSSSLTLNAPLGNFADIASVSANFGMFQQSLISMGTTTMREATVMDQLSIGTSFIIGENSLDTLGQDLQIEPLKQGNISLMAGLVKIDTDGNLSVSGNANFAKNVSVKGTLATHIISPLPDDDLSVNLNKKSDGTSQSLQVTNGAKTTVFSVNDQGDVYATGSAFFARDLVASGAALLSKLNILPAKVEAVSNTEVVAHGSAGTATLKAYQREITIDTPNVTAKSLIYITPQGNTNNQVLYLERQVPGKSFTVGVEQSTLNDIPFNWIIVN